jgi:hypothetical protein
MNYFTKCWAVAVMVVALVSAGLTAASGSTASIAVQDDYSRSISTGWGAANSGGEYVLNDESSFSVSQGAGGIALSAGRQRYATLPESNYSDLDYAIKIKFLNLPSTGSGVYVAPMIRRNSDGSYLQARLRITAQGQPRLSLRSVSSTGLETSLTDDYLPDILVADGSVVRMRVQVAGRAPTAFSAKVWLDGKPEPQDWQSAAETTATVDRGHLGFWAYTSANGSNAAVEVDDLVVTPLSASSPLPPLDSQAADTFTRATAGGWGTADIGGKYTLNNSKGFSVDGTHGVVQVGKGNQRLAVLNDVQLHDVEAVLSAQVRELPETGTGVYFGATMRHGTNGSRFEARVRAFPDGSARLGLRHVDPSGSVTSVGADSILPFGVRTGDTILIRAQTEGVGTLRARAWKLGAPEPSDWQSTGSTTRRTTGDAIGVWAYSSATSGFVVLAIDALSASAPNSLPKRSVPDQAPIWPSAHNTGVPKGTSLTKHSGDLTINEPGAVIDGLDIHGFVAIQAPDVTIRRSIIRGSSTGRNKGIVKITHAKAKNFRLIDSQIIPKNPSVFLDGLKTNTSTILERVDISGTIDGVVILGDQITIKDSFLHGFRHYESDPRWGGGPSHDDAIQIEGGSNILLQGNTIQGAYNASLMVTQNYSATRNLTVTNNRFEGGGCSVHISKKDRPYMSGLTIDDNTFAHGQRVKNCAVFFDPRHSDLNPIGNIWTDGTPAGIVRYP